MRGSDVLAYTTTYHARQRYFPRLIADARGTAGCWFDWAVYAGNPNTELSDALRQLLRDEKRTGIQYLTCWPQNRGQHHATKAALELASSLGYRWLLRIDDDIQFKTQKWLSKMLDRLGTLRRLAVANTEAARGTYDDAGFEHLLSMVDADCIIASPTIKGLLTPPQPAGTLQLGQDFAADLMTILGGACRLMPMQLMASYQPDLTLPIGRGDPETIAKHANDRGALLVRFRDINVKHHTRELEAADDNDAATFRRMSRYWPYIPHTQPAASAP